jgi:UPF0716 protein FxsA
MILFLVALFILAPIAEIYVLLTVGAALGVWAVVFACIATAVIGGFVLRLQGLAAVDAARRDLEAGRAPVEAAADGVFLVIAAPLLMTPGFITDAIGFSLLVPPLRRWIARQALAWLRRRIESGDSRVYIRRF